MDASTVSLLVLFVISAVPFAPTELALIGLGVAAAEQGGSLVPVVLVAAVGCLVCDLVLYATGRRGGAWALRRVRARPGPAASLRWLTDRIERNPVPVLVIARWLPAGGTAGALLAGSLRWPRTVFVTASAIGVTLWSAYAVALGYLGGRIVEEPLVSLVVSLGVAVALASVAGAAFRLRTGHDLVHASGTAGGAALHPAEQA
ncbi:membrane protein DedA with SNARE-associated domain [Prauserella shujinwangii]|uniref:Membrane protein DedA with SNARE-associated domain n=1 Tax=Prauserella shujinwangii TaxID=1453103 RepID=A0A2T0LNH6_9PSEU|nr:VTT domain-containing protein [Prauserella shujinwangii]PRX44744.1 membrane protein DedA with SNARE-associated domain [Prauserella shujinwangii]